MLGHQRRCGSRYRAGTLHILSCNAHLPRGLVGDVSLSPGVILDPERRFQQLVQRSAHLGVRAAATLLVLHQQGGFFFLGQFQCVGQALQLFAPGRALPAEYLI